VIWSLGVNESLLYIKIFVRGLYKTILEILEKTTNKRKTVNIKKKKKASYLPRRKGIMAAGKPKIHPQDK
jgi:hypothetical protein